MTLSLGVSPCPNDCFMIDAIVNRRIDLEGLDFTLHLADVETLNRSAFDGQAEVTKLSYHAYAYCADRYVVLDAGSALGRNCGPLLISKREILRRGGGGRAENRHSGKFTRRISCSVWLSASSEHGRTRLRKSNRRPERTADGGLIFTRTDSRMRRRG